MGYIFWGIEHQPQSSHGLLRVYIDNPSGVTLDDCATVSKQVSSLLDVENLISGSYDLEVSSPGIDRLLFTPEHYVMYLGRVIKLQVYSPHEGQSKFKGLLSNADEFGVTIKVVDKELILPYDNIKKARLLYTKSTPSSK